MVVRGMLKPCLQKYLDIIIKRGSGNSLRHGRYAIYMVVATIISQSLNGYNDIMVI